MALIDIHTHILPGLDDGSDSMEESLEMAYLAVESGTEVVAATMIQWDCWMKNGNKAWIR